MPNSAPILRYRVETSRTFPGMKSVVDIFSGLPGKIGPLVNDCMSGGEAESMAATMNAKDLEERRRALRDR
ncbi:hypothetical protein J2T09_003513 [Neorhizobium huautlense]|uniref:Uncharacterized protein n=1 Tax=Neorhizobium huautlense TaxID=67774 RepID=A0ABT9PW55_9HYPH|nr:hypothetical protein [Neorhizobium huautlense]